MPRFFVEQGTLDGEYATLHGEDCRHIGYSLRMAVGDAVTLSDGCGKECRGILEKITPDEVTVRLSSSETGRGEMPIKVTLYQALPKADKLEWIIQKSVELGVACICPFESSRCVFHLNADRIEHKRQRWEKIAEEAAKQSGRACLVSVGAPLSYEKMLQEARENDLLLFCYEGETALSLRAAYEAHTPAPRTVGIIVGPEGGFSQKEADGAVAAGARSVTLGPRILRCETAPLYALSALSCLTEL